MPRLARIVFSGIPHHITQRGNRREDVFFTDDDRHAYLNWLEEYSKEHQLDVLAYCLMTNHIHLVVVPNTDEGLDKGDATLYRSKRRRSWINSWLIDGLL